MNLFVEELKEISEADLLTLESLMNQLTGRTIKLSREYIDGIKAENSPVKLYAPLHLYKNHKCFVGMFWILLLYGSYEGHL